MTEKNGNGSRKRWLDVAVISGTLGLVSWLITEITVPKVLSAATSQMRAELDQRLKTRSEQVDERFRLLTSQLDKLATTEGLTAVRDRLVAIEDRLREVERKLLAK